MRKWTLIFWMFIPGLHLLFCGTPGNSWETYYEKSGYRETPRYDQTVEFCKKLDDASRWVKYASFGTSPQGRQLPLLIVDKKGNFSPEKVKRSGNAIVLIQACIHAGETDGKDAGLMLIREMVISKELKGLLDHTTLLFIPIFNVDGHERFGPYNRINQNGPEEMGWRVTAQNLNLNRDFLKADAPEMQDWLRLFIAWLPDFLVDCHVTDGADYQYVVTYGVEEDQNIASPLRQLVKNNLLPYLNKNMSRDGFPMFPYISFRNWTDIRSGLVSGAATPRFSTGYGAVQNRIFFLIETHMLKDYKTRVTATHDLLSNIMAFANQNFNQLKEINQRADQETAGQLAGHYLPLTYKTSQKDSSCVEFKGVEYDRVPSDISGGDWVIYHPEKPKTYKMPYFNKVLVTDSAKVPFAYLVPKEWTLEISRLRLHGVNIRRLAKDTTLLVSSYRYKDVKWQEKPYEGHHRVSFELEPVTGKRHYPAGTAVILLNQRTNRVIVNLLEPKGPDSFIAWGYWDTIFEQKEYAESYVLEKLARQMLKGNPELKREFEAKIAADSTFAANPRERLYFFYERSPYWDRQKDLYPVGILTAAADLQLKP